MDDGVDAVDGGRNGALVTDVAFDDLQPWMLGKRGRRPVERAHLMASLEQLRHQVGPYEAGAPGHQHTAKISRQCWITHAWKDK